MSLSKRTMGNLRLCGDLGYIDVYSVFGAQWLSKNVDVESSRIHADGVSRNYVLTIYGMTYRGYVYELSKTTTVTTKGAVYLSRLNVVDKAALSMGRLWNSGELSFIF